MRAIARMAGSYNAPSMLFLKTQGWSSDLRPIRNP